ncbi:MAG: hypothetical protein PCALPYG88_7171 [uncultured Paraburkholderia sp.]|uniref:hypothetical protein n=1 Tax=uncultured Paraburkholderia sp. TaxID=1822466 RepID=UPI0025979FA7|nr:hypothetical protein [uncultured Paraburkholderia sp.]CAH2904098.1 MAG: hypothetical protein PCALPYG08_7202 [uncultured Paraburkholderia sp.]CAH2942292.1 MAG: hypothetical protein PCALPYG88_7171 [uncultured Paraburkholderia sp.]
MQASKTPAYAALVIAVAVGAALSSTIHQAKPPVAALVETPAASALPPSSATPPPLEKVTWQPTTLAWQSVKLKLEAPSLGDTQPTCHMPVGAEDEVGTCYLGVPTQEPIVWRVATVTQRDRFVPARWFADMQAEIKAGMQPQQIADRLSADLTASSSIALSNATLMNPAKLKDGLAITGQATYRPNQSSTDVVTMTCVAAFVLAANRPTQVLYCATTADEAESGTRRMIASLRKLNPSSDLPRNSLQAMERTAYQRLLKAHGGAAANPTLVQSEIEHFEATTADCQNYGKISQERYLCNEQHAKARMGQLGTFGSAG